MNNRPSTRLLRGYGLLLAAALVFALVAALVPTVPVEVRAIATGSGAPGTPAGRPGPASALPASGAEAAAPARGPANPSQPRPGSAGTTPGTLSGPARGGGPRSPADGTGSRPVTASTAPNSAPVRPCPGQPRQVKNDPYSPPCLLFSGDNGGATAKGVSADRIRVAVRLFELPKIAGAEDGPLAQFVFEKNQLKDTISALFEYFNTRFQLYGRRFEPVFFDGKGDITAEFQGGGQETAETDAVKAAEEIKPFAELLAITTPYADALSRRQVVNFGAPFMPREWYEERAPYAWSAAPDCTFVLESASDYLLKRVAKRPASHAGGELRNRPRRLAVIAPENPYYQSCVDAGDKILRAGGAPPAIRIAYKLDFNTESNQAASIVAKLRDAQATTIVCGCDPVLPIFLTSKAQEQTYQPEWILIGAPFSDQDAFGQAYQQDQWSRAFGLSFNGARQATRASTGYFAAKAARPDVEPIELVDFLYSHMYGLALGVQMAGPRLTPETFQAGLYAWGGGTGPSGGWRYTRGRHNPNIDAREIYWDPKRASAQNSKQGAYVEPDPGKRYRPGEWPASDPAVLPSDR